MEAPIRGGGEEFWESENGDKNQTFRKNFHIGLDRCGFRRINIKDRAVKNFVKCFLKIFIKKIHGFLSLKTHEDLINILKFNGNLACFRLGF